MSRFSDTLSGGTRTSLGEADDVIRQLLEDDSKLNEIYELFLDEDHVVAMRASYVAMRVAEQNPDTVKPFASYL
ncbi:MAG: hypothetical protein EBR52_04950 [Microbacteriaceae bacterium]|nr:hypothetical protein [Microbacteriaceae bacterium]